MASKSMMLTSVLWIRSRAVLSVFAILIVAGCASGPSRTSSSEPHFKIGKPYKVNGKWYQPAQDPDYDQIGIASWYGREFQGRPTANGEIFDMNTVSAAHTTLPLPSMVEVVNLENGRKMVVRVNDRGPFARNRIIDLSRAAARRLDFEKQGVARVRVRYLGPAPLPGKSRGDLLARRLSPTPVTPVATKPTVNREILHRAGDLTTLVEETDTPPPSLPQTPAAPAQYAIRVAALLTLDNIDILRDSLGSIGELQLAMGETSDGRRIYRVNVGPFLDTDEAAAHLEAVREAGYSDASIIAISP